MKECKYQMPPSTESNTIYVLLSKTAFKYRISCTGVTSHGDCRYVIRGDINDQGLLSQLFEAIQFTHVLHLAAQVS